MWQKIIATDNNYSWFIARIVLGTVMLAHGLQKAFGWFGGFGWTNSVKYFTDTVGLPAPLAAFIILIETAGALLLILGFAGRINALLMGIVMVGAFFVDHLSNGFYMNWFGNHKGEGYEFDLLFWAITVLLTVNGSGGLSIDRRLYIKRAHGDKVNKAELLHA